jgi:hypothetical protein
MKNFHMADWLRDSTMIKLPRNTPVIPAYIATSNGGWVYREVALLNGCYYIIEQRERLWDIEPDIYHSACRMIPFSNIKYIKRASR